MIMQNAKKLFKWNSSSPYYGEVFSEDFKESMANYLINGFMPGGFVESMLAHDLERALYNADTHNRKVFVAIARWIREECPKGSHGSYEAVQNWCADRNSLRSNYALPLVRQYTWDVLKEPA